MFSQTSEYALRAVVWLADHHGDGPVGNKRIASDTMVPASYLSKILHDLASAGFLSSRRGVGGGFQLIVDPKELTMLDVVNAVDPLKRISFCAHSKGDSSQPMCPMHQRLNKAIGLVQKTLSESTIQDVMQSPPSAAATTGQTTRTDEAHQDEMIHTPAAKLDDAPTARQQEVSTFSSILAASGAG